MDHINQAEIVEISASNTATVQALGGKSGRPDGLDLAQEVRLQSFRFNHFAGNLPTGIARVPRVLSTSIPWIKVPRPEPGIPWILLGTWETGEIAASPAESVDRM